MWRAYPSIDRMSIVAGVFHLFVDVPFPCNAPLRVFDLSRPSCVSGIKQDAQKGRPARPQRAKGRGVPSGYVEGLNDARTPLADFFSILVASKSTFERICPSMRCCVSRTTGENGAKPLKANEFKNNLEWSKVCVHPASCFHNTPEETGS